MQEGRISYNDYVMLLIWRCELVANQPTNQRAQQGREGRENDGALMWNGERKIFAAILASPYLVPY
jgi:hypothetical protein